jgi:hypothetical protein
LALLAFAAFVASLLALRAEKKQLLLLSERQEEDLQDRRRDQARLVSGWLMSSQVVKTEGKADEITTMLHLRNGSQEPVYQVAVLVTDGVDDPSTYTAWLRNTLPPDHTLHVELTLPLGTTLPKEESGFGTIYIWFADSAGRAWQRLPDGRLVETGRGMASLPLQMATCPKCGGSRLVHFRSSSDRGHNQLGEHEYCLACQRCVTWPSCRRSATEEGPWAGSVPTSDSGSK